MPNLTNFIQHSIGSPNHSNHQKKKKKKPNWKGISKTVTICRLQDTTYRKPWRCHKNLLELTSEFSKLAEYKINCSTIHNTCDMEAMQMPSDRWMGRWVFVCVRVERYIQTRTKLEGLNFLISTVLQTIAIKTVVIPAVLT